MAHDRVASMERFSVLILLLCLRWCFVGAQCPWQESGLKPWSDPATWGNGRTPGSGEVVEITEGILLNMSPPKLAEVHIEDGGKLVWDIGGRFELQSGRIHISGGGAIIVGGSEPQCRYPENSRAIITLTGQKDEFADEAGFGQKFIGIQANGTLELHGAEKISWTKLSGTVHKLNSSTGLVFDHDEVNWHIRIPGLYVYVMDPATGTPVDFRHFRYNRRRHMEKKLPNFLRSLNVNDGQVIMLASRATLFDTSLDIDYTLAINALEEIGAVHVGEYQEGNAWAMIAVTGQPNLSQEELTNEKGFIYTETWPVTLEYQGFIYTVQCGITLPHSPKDAVNYVRFRVLDRIVQPIIDVIDDVSSWKPGDRIIVTSTDYPWIQTEEPILVSCPTCASNQIKLNRELFYTHWGVIENNVDMRAEVAVLTRNVVVRGDMSDACYGDNQCEAFSLDTFGGHIMVVHGFKAFHVQGVEFVHLGQQSVEGSYPIHFHMAMDLRGNNADAIVAQNSIHHTFSRCLTTHQTSGVKVTDNVAYLHFGHCFFLEDGGEKYNEFGGNLVLGTLRGSLLPSDMRPASFWFTNPLVYCRNNVAAGSEGRGFMYVFPLEPRGMSQGKGLMALGEAARTPLLQFENNVAHSNALAGLWMDNILGQAGEVIATGNAYMPEIVLENNTVIPYEVVLSRFTGYKNKIQNAWVRGSPMRMSQCSFSDSLRGMTFALAGAYPQYVRDSVFVGQSANTGEPAVILDRNTRRYIRLPRSTPDQRINTPVTGALFYDHAVYFENNWFAGFKNDQYRLAGAIGFKRRDTGFTSPTNGVRSAKFAFRGGSDGNRMLDGDEADGFGGDAGDRHKATRDFDGSVTGRTDVFVVKPRQFVNTQNCYNKTDWNLAVCPDRMAKIRLVKSSQADVKLKENMYMVRDDFHKHLEYFDGAKKIGPLVINGYSYTMHFVGPSPDYLEFRLHGFERHFRVRIGICFPKNSSSFTIQKKYFGSDFTFASSIEDFETKAASSHLVAYWDSSTGLLFLYFEGKMKRLDGDDFSCPLKKCPIIKITRNDGGYSPAFCYPAAYGPYARDPVPPNGDAIVEPAPAKLVVTPSPGDGIGAGASKPFTIRSNP
ncbi:cell surface hyaluronidase-like [Lingula anatina]|uniref:Cell surface hyaluronidase-like n=1 Tax=Lingula anatina TaxID=7574 RepID=A0A2R2MQH7_LINAN|nr:cell surface hyaluronidase-like [Lingula anatina]|eukprot:XP_023932501.1 cell surface hyaluronidase-like [Lingula anatina]